MSAVAKPIGRFCGLSLRRRHTPGACLTKNVFEPGSEIAEHSHDTAHFTFVDRGGYREFYGPSSVSCEAGDVLWVPCGILHGDRVSAQGAETLSVELRSETLERAAACVDIPSMPLKVPAARLRALIKLIHAEFEAIDDVSILMLDGLVMQLVAAAFSGDRAAPSGAEPWLMQVKADLDANYSDAPSVEALAAGVSVDPKHLMRSFRSRYGVSIGEYLRRRRIEAACERLELTNEPVASIAAELGFFDQSHFTRFFRRYRGSTPGDYRKAFR